MLFLGIRGKVMGKKKEETGQDQAQAAETISKMEAVRRLLADDPEMKPGDGIEAVKKRFGLEMSTGNFSAYKSQIRSKGKDGQAAPPKKGGRPKAQAAGASSGTAADPYEAAQQVKVLVDKYGADSVKNLADLFRKG
jgi:hypothetical protein